MTSPLRALLNIITSGVETIESTYSSHGVQYPSLDEPFHPDSVNDPNVIEATNFVVSAAAQLIATLNMPASTLFEAAGSMHTTSAIATVNALNVSEILREAGPQGLHTKDIGDRAGTDPHKIGRILRYLATRHIFREISPEVFTNNRISSLLDTGKSTQDIKSNPGSKHDDASGVSAVIGHLGDECFKASLEMTAAMVDPKKASSQEPNEAPLNLAFGTPLSYFDWIELPENEYRLKRFGLAFQAVNNFIPSNTLIQGFDWGSLKENDIVVDVGGGVGAVTLHLAKAYPHLKYVIQDRVAVVPDGLKFWKIQYPEALENGQVKLEAHDFFKPQPIKDASVFLMRFILHDWADKYAKRILIHLRAAAKSSTKLVIVDNIVPYAAPSKSECANIPGAQLPEPPYPLLPNLGIVSSTVYTTDMQMLIVANAQERTLGQFVNLVDGTGWKLDHITRSGLICHLVFIPV